MPARFPPRAPDPATAGIGLRTPHFEALAARAPALSFLEVHSENYFAEGGPALAWLERFRADYAVSLHGVGLSLGSADPLDPRHLDCLAALAGRIEPALVSEHLCWSSIGGTHLGELLPLPCTEEALAHVCRRVTEVQERLRRPILVENAPAVLASAICENRQVSSQTARQEGPYAFADAVDVVVHQNDCGEGSDMRFEVNRNTRKTKK